ncbi:MAG: heat-inducible transcriptional repressor HrcA [Armatimonadota bacterium]|nr:heat-inducible transcriptional repressor HrcA [Armatimonadota bacterium]MCX7777605.1 heat-inducible transcriptional repressor HrcA [Armatimonadota bacterium]MDW8024717.1 heat-inducible transcriptional repressor HrcA [Armatimonadota bacterium]
MRLCVSNLELNPRRERILQAVVEKHIETAMPVSSETVAREYNLGISPATVRLEFAALESMGLVKQPHTSAGRVPSDMGYRVYVDRILKLKPLNPKELWRVRSTFQVRYGVVEDLLNAACELLASLTGYVALASFMVHRHKVLKELCISPVNSKRLLIVTVLSDGGALHRLFYSAVPIERNNVERASSILKEALCGLRVDQILRLRTNTIIQRLGIARQVDKKLWEVLCTGFEMIQKTLRLHGITTFVSSISPLLSQPEFADAKRAQALIEVLNDPPEWLLQTPLEVTTSAMPWTAIGVELLGGTAPPPFNMLAECGAVGAPYFVGETPTGAIMVLGPKRMRYGIALSVVKEVTKWLSASLTTLLS